MLEASPEASKMGVLCFVDKARSVLDLRARVVLAPISNLKRGVSTPLVTTKRALERASEAFHLVASPSPYSFRLSSPGLV